MFVKETHCLSRSCLEHIGHRQTQTKQINGKTGWQKKLCKVIMLTGFKVTLISKVIWMLSWTV